jgi:release factor glutamine methyltransferase
MMENQTIPTIESAPRRLAEVLLDGARRLHAGGIDGGRLDAELLLGHILDMTREQLVVNANWPLSISQSERYQGLLWRRLRREPVAYITGRRGFWSLDFLVTSDVLIPRPETERLVEIALKLAAEMDAGAALRILDLGTGSGAIAIAMASELPAAEIFATDVSTTALAVAQANAARNRPAGRIRFFHGDLFAAVNPATPKFHLILSNPPYIRRGEIDGLEPEVSRWEPREALDGGVDGLDFYRRIAAEAFDHLCPDGAIIVEIGAAMGASVAGLFQSSSGCSATVIEQDYCGRDRVVVARRSAA